MNNQIIESDYIEFCKNLSPQELSKFIDDCLDKQRSWQQFFDSIPYESETYDYLIELFEEKLENENKVTWEVEKESVKIKWRIQKERELRELEVKSAVSRLMTKKVFIFQQRNKIEFLIKTLRWEFNKLNKLKLSISQLGELLQDAEVENYNSLEPLEIIRQNKSYKLCYELTLLDISELIESLPDIKYKWNKKYAVEMFEKVKAFAKNFMLPPNFQLSESTHDILMEVENIFWKVLPQGEFRLGRTIKHFRKLSQSTNWKKKEFDERRIERIEKFLTPTKCYIGCDGFEGYAIYCFNRTNKVILESPYYGNATYVISDGWKEIAKLTKWEAKYEHSSQVTTVNHTHTWFDRLKEELKK